MPVYGAETAECDLSSSNGHHKTANNKTFVENFDLMKHFVQAGQSFGSPS